MPMDAETPLIKPLEARLNAFLRDEVNFVLWQAARLEGAMQLHQSRMEEVCHAIKAHYHWANFEPCFPDRRQCKHCGASISPEFSFRRHLGFCTLREKQEAARSPEYAFEDSWV